MTQAVNQKLNKRDKLNSEEIERYARHIILPEIGGVGQQKLKEAKVLVVGAGGLGSPVLSYLAAAGVGHLGIVDDDHVSLSNLQRQIIHSTKTIGEPKTKSAKNYLQALNPYVQITLHSLRINADNAKNLIESYDIIVDGSDNFSTRYLLAEISEKAKKPYVSGAISRFEGSVTVFMPYCDNNPRLIDLFPNIPPENALPTCAEAGVIGVLPGVIGSLQAMEVIKLITNIGESLVGRLLLYNSLSTRFDIIKYKRKS